MTKGAAYFLSCLCSPGATNAQTFHRMMGMAMKIPVIIAAIAFAIGYVLADRVFQIPFAPNPLVWLIGTALVAGGLLAFALSFDEVIVTTFTAGAQQTLPIWIFTNLSRSVVIDHCLTSSGSVLLNSGLNPLWISELM